MLTFTQMKKKAASYCGIYDSSPEMGEIISDINTGIKRFQNAARRYWTRHEKKTSLIKNCQYYQFPSDMLRIHTVRVKNGERLVPITQVYSEDEWEELNTTPLMASGSPNYFFVKGSDEIGLYPIPSQDVSDGLVVSYEPRMVDMSIDDVLTTANLVENSTDIVGLSGDFVRSMTNDCYLTVEGGLDGNWYKISKYIDANHIQIENNYQGITEHNAKIRIGQCPPFPEEYHQAPIHYAAQQFYLMRKDLESASMHGQLFDKAFSEYRNAYGTKTDGGVINSRRMRFGTDRRVFPGRIG